MSENSSESKSSPKGLMIAIVFAAVVIAGSLVFLGSQMSGIDLANLSKEEAASLLEEIKNKVTASYEELVDDDPVRGDANAPVTIVEFSDYGCSFCQKHFRETIPRIKQDYIDTGKVKYVFRDLPYRAMLSSLAANCTLDQGGDDLYYRFNGKIFEGGGKLGQEALLAIAAELEMDSTKFEECLSSKKYNAEILNDMQAAVDYGIEGTPGFILTNGKESKIVRGAIPYSNVASPTDFKREIEALLN